MLRGIGDGLGEPGRPGAPALEGLVRLRRVGAVLEREPLHERDFLDRVARETVDRDDGLEAEARDVPEVPLEIRGAALDRVEAALGLAAVVLERLGGGHEHDRARRAAPPTRQMMLKNFSIPMSDPKPDSVTTYSPSFRATRSATSELLPCAMFANGPQCTSAGCPSIVWTRFGLIASFSSTVIAPAARSCSASTGSPSYV